MGANVLKDETVKDDAWMPTSCLQWMQLDETSPRPLQP